MSARHGSPVSVLAVRSPGLVGLLVSVLVLSALPLAALRAVAAAPDHLLISEVVTGGASASDELIELYNPTASPLPLEGLELVYVSASGATVSRRAAWPAGSAPVQAHGHLLVANEAGIYAAVADAVYTTGMAATGGSVALRIQGAATAIDAAGWGTATGTWLEGSPAPAPPAGSSIERLPGGAFGSTQDTDANATDFVVRAAPDPQNSASEPTPGPTQEATPTPDATGSPEPSPSASGTASATPIMSPLPTATATTTPTTSATATPNASSTATPAPTIDVATARSLPDGALVTVEAVALTDSAFTDGGGYVADVTAGIAVLVSGGAFARGDHLRVTGTVDDRYAQRTIRADGADVAVLGTSAAPSPRTTGSGQVGESVEGSLVRLAATIVAGPTTLSSGPAYDVDDGTGAARVLVPTSSGIDTAAWSVGAVVELVGVVGQRDSSGTGTGGYRVQPRDPADVLSVTAAPGGSPAPSSSPGTTPTPAASASPSPGAGVVSIAEARQAAKNVRVTIRGVVTLPSGLVDEGTAVVQDATGAIALRLGDDAGALPRGRLVEVTGGRSTKSGMETVRVTQPPTDLGTSSEPGAPLVRSGDVGEALEARLVVVRGAVASPRRSSSGAVSFDVDDGSGPVRVVVAAEVGFDAEFEAGDWIEVVGVVGQETTGTLPLRGYRLWPRDANDLRVTAAVTGLAADAETSEPAAVSDRRDGESAARSDSLDGIDRPDISGADLEIGATLVATRWPELGLAGLLWDGERLVAIDEDAATAIGRSISRVTVPMPLRLTGLSGVGHHEATDVAIVTIRSGHVESGGGRAPPATQLPAEGQSPRWVTLVGRLAADSRSDRATLDVAGAGQVTIVHACATHGLGVGAGRQVSVTGIGSGAPDSVTVGCDGVRAAPALSAPSTAGSAPPRAVLTTSSRPGERDALTDHRRQVAALVLLVGLLLVVGAALARALRRNAAIPGRSEGAGDDADDEGSGEGSQEALAPQAPEVRVPTLTLVAVPRERGP